MCTDVPKFRWSSLESRIVQRLIRIQRQNLELDVLLMTPAIDDYSGQQRRFQQQSPRPFSCIRTTSICAGFITKWECKYQGTLRIFTCQLFAPFEAPYVMGATYGEATRRVIEVLM